MSNIREAARRNSKKADRRVEQLAKRLKPKGPAAAPLSADEQDRFFERLERVGSANRRRRFIRHERHAMFATTYAAVSEIQGSLQDKSFLQRLDKVFSKMDPRPRKTTHGMIRILTGWDEEWMSETDHERRQKLQRNAITAIGVDARAIEKLLEMGKTPDDVSAEVRSGQLKIELLGKGERVARRPGGMPTTRSRAAEAAEIPIEHAEIARPRARSVPSEFNQSSGSDIQEVRESLSLAPSDGGDESNRARLREMPRSWKKSNWHVSLAIAVHDSSGRVKRSYYLTPLMLGAWTKVVHSVLKAIAKVQKSGETMPLPIVCEEEEDDGG